MKSLLTRGVFLLLLASSGLSQHRPKFSDYPTRSSFKGKSAHVRLVGDNLARLYRTQLRNAAAAGPNFAGRYAMGTWGCGSPCLMAGMVDLMSGKVIWPPIPAMMVFDISFHMNSRLLIINSREVLEKNWPTGPPKWIEGEWPEELFFVWNGKRFVIRSARQ